MDNLSAHSGPEVDHLFRMAGHIVVYRPTHSPDFAPIEYVFSWLKGAFKVPPLATPSITISCSWQCGISEGLINPDWDSLSTNPAPRRSTITAASPSTTGGRLFSSCSQICTQTWLLSSLQSATTLCPARSSSPTCTLSCRERRWVWGPGWRDGYFIETAPGQLSLIFTCTCTVVVCRRGHVVVIGDLGSAIRAFGVATIPPGSSQRRVTLFGEERRGHLARCACRLTVRGGVAW